MFQGKLKKYRGLFIAVSSLVAFFLLYLAINLALQAQAVEGVKYANFVSSVGEKMESASANDSALSANLTILKNGGQVGDDTYKSLAKFVTPLNAPIDQVLSAYSAGDLAQARQSFTSVKQLVDEKAAKKVALGSTLQIIGAVLTLLLYALVVVPMFFRIKETDETVESSQKETEGIMGTVSEGLFLLSSDHEIGVEQSASLKGMFKLERDLEGNFFDFILNYVTQDSVNIARDYIELLFGDRVKEKLVEDLNPLKAVEINLIRRDGSYENRYLDFKFKRVLVDGELSHLLGSVTDVTKQVLLEQQLIESKEEQEAQIDLLMSILHVDNKQLRSFFNSTESALNGINERLEARGHDDGQIRSKLRDISRDVHRIKGDAAALNLNNFEFAAHALEDEIHTVQTENKKISGKLLIPTATKLRDLFTELERMKSLMSKFADAMDGMSNTTPVMSSALDLGSDDLGSDDLGSADLGSDVAPQSEVSEGEEPKQNADSKQADDIVHSSESAEPASDQHQSEELEQTIDADEEFKEQPIEDMSGLSINIDTPSTLVELDTAHVEPANDKHNSDQTLHTSLKQLANKVGERSGVEVKFHSRGLGDNEIPDQLNETLNSTLVQMVRNSITHGGESPDVREFQGKSKALNIHAEFKQVDDKYQLTVRDDGAGINSEKIIKKAFEKGLISKKQAETFGPKEATTLIFMPGFSSKNEVSLDGGRGVGLDLVFDLTKQHNGKISVKSGNGKFCRFVFTYPAS